MSDCACFTAKNILKRNTPFEIFSVFVQYRSRILCNKSVIRDDKMNKMYQCIQFIYTLYLKYPRPPFFHFKLNDKYSRKSR